MKKQDLKKAVKEIMTRDDDMLDPMAKAEALERKTATLAAEESGDYASMMEERARCSSQVWKIQLMIMAFMKKTAHVLVFY